LDVPAARRLVAALAALALAALGSPALAQLGQEPATILDQLRGYGVREAGAGHESASGFAFGIEESLGTAVAVEGEGELTDANARFIGALIGAASGYGSGIASPVTDFFRTRTAELADAGEVVVQVQEYLMEVEVTGGEPARVRVRFEPQSVPEELFGPPAHALGPADARYVVREFTDLQCPFCANFAAQGMPLIARLLERGDVRFELHHLPLKSVHPNATVAAEAAECVAAEAGAAGGDQAGEDAFWMFADALFAQQSRWAELPDPLEQFVAIAAEAGLAVEELPTCVRTGRFSDLVEESYRVAVQDLGITGTPTIFVDGLRVGDYLDPESYERLMRLSDAMAAALGNAAED
ncbi:MAG TPA: thioredoxin domain-containing protein, partial [Trueperaceae bacterium]|nr:thioredoxin domain-containing protein [Trueperaceae bacterium]